MSRTTSPARRERRVRVVLERLADWLLGEEIAFRKLDAHRQDLGLDVPAFARLLGVSPATFASWRKARAVPLGSRERMHESVLGALSAASPCSDTGAVRSTAQTTRFEPVLGGLARRLHGVTARLAFRTVAPSATTPAEGDWQRAPHLWLGLEGAALRHDREQGRGVRLAELRALHGVGCECGHCAAAARCAPRRPSRFLGREAAV